ncbi:MAG TPA: hypothetical protein VHO03_06150 [Ignavibacteriales bacterium]|nr:hypothetical protein [Ignavibacteriales bacterium]
MKTLFLGSGYAGDYFRSLYPYSIHTSRSLENLRRRQIRGVVFNSEVPETWENLNRVKPDGIIISFPLTDSCFTSELERFLRTLTDKIVIIGSTSAYREDLPVVSDDSPLDTLDKRASVEETFRLNGAAVLHSAGIYGKGRNPLDWLRRGLVKDINRTVNLIHAVDLVRACNFLLENFRPGENFVISDNHPYRWLDILNFAVVRKMISEASASEIRTGTSDRPPRIIRPCRLFEEGFTLKHPDLLEELRKLEEPA